MPIGKSLFLLLALIFLAGCSWPGSSQLFGADPGTGGVDAAVSPLLDIPLPNGLQRYAGHGFVNQTTAGGKEGLEILRGPVDARATAISLFNTLKNNGWQLLGTQRKNSRAAYLYGKNGEHAIISFRPQGALTIVEIWRAPILPPDADLQHDDASEEPLTSFAPEEFGPNDESPGAPLEERWEPLEEKPL